MGIKRKHEDDVRTVIFDLALSKKEKMRLAEKAEALGISQSDLLRLGAFGVRGLRVDPEEKRRVELLTPVFQDLAGIGNNVNQIAKQVNTTVLAGEPIDVHSIGHKLLKLLKKMQEVELSIAETILTERKKREKAA